MTMTYTIEEIIKMVNNFRNGYTCKKCVSKERHRWIVNITPMTPVYFRMNKKFVFAGFVNCSEHGITEAVALRDL